MSGYPFADADPEHLRPGEQRWPMAAAVITAGVLHEFLPDDFRVTKQVALVYPIFLLVFLAVLIRGDPGRVDLPSRRLCVITSSW